LFKDNQNHDENLKLNFNAPEMVNAQPVVNITEAKIIEEVAHSESALIESVVGPCQSLLCLRVLKTRNRGLWLDLSCCVIPHAGMSFNLNVRQIWRLCYIEDRGR